VLKAGETGFRIWGLGYRRQVRQDLGFRVLEVGFRVLEVGGTGFRV